MQGDLPVSTWSESALSVFGASGIKEAAHVRRIIRQGGWTSHTSGLASEHVQGNVVILPADEANDFLRYCQRNPKPCPVLAVSEPGQAGLPALGTDIDICTDLPRYRVWRHGEVVDEPHDIVNLWRADLVTFVIGCSFSFEQALLEDGIPLRHIASGSNVPMYRTNINTVPAGRFSGPLVVSMRPLKPADAIRAVQITSRFPAVHGAPVHIGKPELLGIKDVMKPDYGDPVAVEADELPVFWACGVTPQSVIEAVKPAFCITHAPGYMLVTDLKNSRMAIL